MPPLTVSVRVMDAQALPLFEVDETAAVTVPPLPLGSPKRASLNGWS